MKYGGFVVDKTLACKALLEESSNAVRISLPRRFGKSFNLSVIAQFFNPITTLDDCTAGVEPPDFAAAYRRRREMFSGSLLQEMHSDFFDRHFAAIPVIHLNFKARPVSSHDECSVVERKPRGDPRHLKHKAWRKYESLRRTYFAMDAKFVDDADQWEERSDLACALFDKLSEFVAAQHGGEYIILIDEYDTPLRKALDTD
ncbi:hypothetical protein H4R18_002581 [Coemansia javaensis]|uniref:AAA-ATPase-like domain-containing protein n=1 Tax=Coemansia javaensis TaxID=2761396 RepID=A0A9W8HEN9_9FUNG|nr:hypothetical protein H4R18_002581 [Coemansia javaensis]